MKFDLWKVRIAALLAATSLVVVASAADKKNQAKSAPAETVDSGSFGVFVKGQRVATETFSIQQQTGSSAIKSQVKQTAGADAISQKSDLEITVVECLRSRESARDAAREMQSGPSFRR